MCCTSENLKKLDKLNEMWYTDKVGSETPQNERDVTQLGRVLALGARRRRFESCRLDHVVSDAGNRRPNAAYEDISSSESFKKFF